MKSISGREAFLSDFFERHDKDFAAFVRIARPIVISFARRRSYRLLPDQREDVFQEVCTRVLELPNTAFDRTRVTGSQYLYGLTLNAIRKVERQYGVRSGESPEFICDADLDQIPSPLELIEDIHRSMVLQSVLSQATPQLRTCLIAIGEGSSADDAARKVGWSRFKLRREKLALQSLVVTRNLATIKGTPNTSPSMNH